MLCSYGLFSQTTSKPLNHTIFSEKIERVIHDFPNNFRNITGEPLLIQAEFENYSSLVLLPDAQSCVITRYHSLEDTTASWQAFMLRMEDFEKAQKQYRQLYNQLKDCYLLRTDGSAIYLKGEWHEPREENVFTTSTLKLENDNWPYGDMQIVVELLYQAGEWLVDIHIDNKKKDDAVGGKKSED